MLGELDGIVAVEAFKELYNVILGLPIRLIVPCGFHSNAFLKIFLSSLFNTCQIDCSFLNLIFSGFLVELSVSQLNLLYNSWPLYS